MQTLTTTAIYDAKRKILIPQELPPYRRFTVRVVFIPQTPVAPELDGNFTDDELQVLESASLADYLQEEEKPSATELAYYHQLLK
ncbi:MAG: hypothetical protein HY564_01450 [Candidatus Jacksonbacteria bacterium]|nr:hypothetical protein [Candidatus Jacksonbacteria bacterium]